MADKDILEFDQSSENTADADSDDENGKNNAAPVPTSSEIKNVMKRFACEVKFWARRRTHKGLQSHNITYDLSLPTMGGCTLRHWMSG
ncbi:hypothetical protein TNCV_4443391 [Trichonephila clavipes]|nr:hypothetical protein TNCV_4443391 [Trichonephila clavipes]